MDDLGVKTHIFGNTHININFSKNKITLNPSNLLFFGGLYYPVCRENTQINVSLKNLAGFGTLWQSPLEVPKKWSRFWWCPVVSPTASLLVVCFFWFFFKGFQQIRQILKLKPPRNLIESLYFASKTYFLAKPCIV